MRVATRRPAWGFEAQEHLAAKAIQEPAIWNQLFNGWREAQLTSALWQQLLDSFESLPNWEPCADGIAEVLYAGSTRKENFIPNELMEQAFRLSLKSFVVLQSKKDEYPAESKDWLGLAVDRLGGKLAMFWLEYLSRLKRRSDTDWKGLPDSISDLFREIAEGESGDSSFARVILVSQLHYLHFLDKDFAAEVIVPLLDWSRDPICAAQCWQGFLGWGQWKTSFIDLILPFYQQTLNHLSEFESQHLDAFAAHVATIAVFGVESPLLPGWLYPYIKGFDTNLRTEFASTIREVLEGMSPEASSHLWLRWLKQYWNDRLIRKPSALASLEVNEMALWPLHLNGKFAEAVELLKQSPRFDRMTVNVKQEITTEHKTTFTDATGEYLNLLLGSLSRGHHQIGEMRTLFDELLTLGLSSEIAEKIRATLAKFE